MRVLVTGAKGFIGRYVVEAFSKHWPNSKIFAGCRSESCEDFLHLSNVKTVYHNLWNEDHSITFQRNYDIIVHLSWPSIHRYNDPCHVNEVLPAQKRFIDQALRFTSNLTISGTCFEYGLIDGALIEDIEANPVTQYGIAKNELRKYVFDSAPENTWLKWLRIFYVYGQGQSTKSLIPQLENAIASNEESFNMSGGQQVRDYLLVNELAEIIVKVAKREKIKGIFNCSSNKPVVLEAFVKKFITNNYPDSKINLNLGFYPYNDLEPFAFWGDNSKLISLLNDDYNTPTF
ncbi:NAD(P)-dependent oxidoreductase [Fulvivirga ulvae]|uniref:NAD-dependent epimerase/dehydratase family protein n=1 Tax=Fulvivirga ulvae TaxID=2904245 RepID=UPI001F42E4ED|nr:NAD(P)-dependent oxidoreductase [Fulvivirga ulvae]UII33375.1 NAD(P)-dependent oxidoreductase [Fulvivirga ulvae]